MSLTSNGAPVGNRGDTSYDVTIPNHLTSVLVVTNNYDISVISGIIVNHVPHLILMAAIFLIALLAFRSHSRKKR